MNIDKEKLKALAEAAQNDSGDYAALNDYGMAVPPAVTLALLAEIERLEGLRPEGPPRPPEGESLPRYGLRWNGPQQPLSVPMDDGYWTPWHLANELHKDAERSKRMLLDACVSIGSIGEALGLDMDADADMMIGTASDLIDGLNRIAKECPLGSPGFAIACEVHGELGVQQEVQP